MKFDISVVVCTYNRCESLKDTLGALSKQQIADGILLEILVVDNNSHDATKKVIEEEAQRSRWPMKYIFEGNQGKSYALNRAIKEACGELVVFTDDDVLPSRHWVSNLWNAYREHNAQVLGGPIRPLWENRPPQWLQNQQFQDYLALLDRGSKLILTENFGSDFLYGANLAVKRSLLLKIGGFRTDLGPNGEKMMMRGEDSELVGRLGEQHVLGVYIPEAIIHHKVSAARMKLSYLRKWRFWAGISWAIKNGSSPRIPLWLVWECSSYFVGVFFFWITRNQIRQVSCERIAWFQLGMNKELITRFITRKKFSSCEPLLQAKASEETKETVLDLTGQSHD